MAQKTGDLLDQFYHDSLTLLTDLYQLTMAYGYWKNNIHDQEGVFHLFFRKLPFKSGYALAAGLDYVIHYLNQYRFRDDDLAYLRTLTGNNGAPLFEEGFLEYLKNMEFTCDIEAVPEGTLVFPHEPLIRVRGPLIQAQLIETPLLNMVNFQTLIATKSNRICRAARGESVLEFGLRRAQGIDGALAASRAAYLGGGGATSNLLAGKLFDIPVKGTHAHSWVMTFDSELESFEKYAAAMPNNSLFLVDTYDTVQGVKYAVAVGKKLREQGHEMLGIRLDSGDLAYLSIKAREILDAGGFPDASIVASNDLDEYLIDSLKQQGAKINVWGVGTKLATAYDQPALGGVYKLAALKKEGKWHYKVKLSEQAIKVSNPGCLQVRRYIDQEGFYQGDMIYDETLDVKKDQIIDPGDFTRRKTLAGTYKDLLVPVFKDGTCCYETESLEVIRKRVNDEVTHLHKGICRLSNPHEYPVGLEEELYLLKQRLIMKARGLDEA